MKAEVTYFLHTARSWVAPDTELAGYQAIFLPYSFILKTFSINKTCIHFWSLFHSYFRHIEEVLKKGLFLETTSCLFNSFLFFMINTSLLAFLLCSTDAAYFAGFVLQLHSLTFINRNLHRAVVHTISLIQLSDEFIHNF